MNSPFLHELVNDIDKLLEKSNNYPKLADSLPAVLNCQVITIRDIYKNHEQYKNIIDKFIAENESHYTFKTTNYLRSLAKSESVSKNRIDKIRIETRHLISSSNQDFTSYFFELTTPVSDMHYTINEATYNDNIELKKNSDKIQAELHVAKHKYQIEADFISEQERRNTSRDSASYTHKKQLLLKEIESLKDIHREEVRMLKIQLENLNVRKKSEEQRMKEDHIHNGRLLNEQISYIYDYYEGEKVVLDRELDGFMKPLYQQQKDLVARHKIDSEIIAADYDFEISIVNDETKKIAVNYIIKLKQTNKAQDQSLISSTGKTRKDLEKQIRKENVEHKFLHDQKISLLNKKLQSLDNHYQKKTDILNTNYKTNVLLLEKEIFHVKEENNIKNLLAQEKMNIAVLPIEKKINALSVSSLYDTNNFDNKFEVLTSELESKINAANLKLEVKLLELTKELQLLDNKLSNDIKNNKSIMQLDIQKEALKRNFSEKFASFSHLIEERNNSKKKMFYKLELQRLTTAQNFERQFLRLRHNFKKEILEQDSARQITKLNFNFSITRENANRRLYEERIKAFTRRNNYTLELDQEYINHIYSIFMSHLSIFRPTVFLLQDFYIENRSNNQDIINKLVTFTNYISDHYRRYYKSLLESLVKTHLGSLLTLSEGKFNFLHSEVVKNFDNGTWQFRKAREEFEHSLVIVNKNIEKTQEDITRNRVNLILYQERQSDKSIKTIDEDLEIYNLVTNAKLAVFRLNVVLSDLLTNQANISDNIQKIDQRLNQLVTDKISQESSLNNERKNEETTIRSLNKVFIGGLTDLINTINELRTTYISILGKLRDKESPVSSTRISEFLEFITITEKEIVSKHLLTLDTILQGYYFHNSNYETRQKNHLKVTSLAISDYKKYYGSLLTNFDDLDVFCNKRLETVSKQTTNALSEITLLINNTYNKEIKDIDNEISTIRNEMNNFEVRLEFELDLLLKNQDDAKYELEAEHNDSIHNLSEKYDSEINILIDEIKQIETDYSNDKSHTVERSTVITKRYQNSIDEIELTIKNKSQSLEENIKSLNIESIHLDKLYLKDLENIRKQNGVLITSIKNNKKEK